MCVEQDSDSGFVQCQCKEKVSGVKWRQIVEGDNERLSHSLHVRCVEIRAGVRCEASSCSTVRRG